MTTSTHPQNPKMAECNPKSWSGDFSLGKFDLNPRTTLGNHPQFRVAIRWIPGCSDNLVVGNLGSPVWSQLSWAIFTAQHLLNWPNIQPRFPRFRWGGGNPGDFRPVRRACVPTFAHRQSRKHLPNCNQRPVFGPSNSNHH